MSSKLVTVDNVGNSESDPIDTVALIVNTMEESNHYFLSNPYIENNFLNK